LGVKTSGGETPFRGVGGENLVGAGG